MKTLKQIIEENPEAIELPVAIYKETGELEFIGESGFYYIHEVTEGEHKGKILVFSGN